MPSMNIPQEITATITVEKLGAVRTEKGTQLLNVFIPDLGIKLFSTTMFFPIPVAAELKPADVFTATISRGKLKPNKEGAYANEFYWDFISLQDDSEAQPQPVTAPPPAAKDAEAITPTPAPRTLGLDERIAWNSAINNAVHALSAHWVGGYGEPWINKVITVALPIYDAIRRGPIAPEEPALPESVDVDDDGGFGVINLDAEEE